MVQAPAKTEVGCRASGALIHALCLSRSTLILTLPDGLGAYGRGR